MQVLVDNIEVSIEDTVVNRSPYLRTIRDTSVGVSMVDNIVTMDVLSLKEFLSYKSFIGYGNITCIATLYKVCDYMGHYDIPKDHNYTNGYYKAILFDWWNLKYGPKKLEVLLSAAPDCYVKAIDDIMGTNDYYIGGLYVLRKIFDGIPWPNADIYSLSKDTIEYAINHCKVNGISCVVHPDHVSIDLDSTNITIKIKTKEYPNTCSILDDVSVDCCSLLYYSKDSTILCNNRGSYSITNHINNFCPERYTSDYCISLLRFQSLGIRYYLPGLDRSIVYDRHIEDCIVNYHKINHISEVPWMDITLDPKLLGHYCKDTYEMHEYMVSTYDTIDILVICYTYGLKIDPVCCDTKMISIDNKDYTVQLKSMQDFYNLTRF